MPNLTPEQIEQRKAGVSASEAAQALGLSQWGTAYELWLAKRGEAERKPPSDEMALGHLLEPVIAQLYEAEHEVTVAPVKETFVHPDMPWLMATPDYRVIERPQTLLEAKSVNAYRKREFGEDGSDEVPMDILVQCLAQMAVMQPLHGVNRVDVGVLVGGNEYLEFFIHYDKAAVDRLIERLADFYQKVQAGVPPAPQSLADTRRMFSRDVGRVVEASKDVARYVDELRNIRALQKDLEEKEEYLLLGIQSHMQDASTLILPDGQIAATWKKAKDSQRVDSEKLKKNYPRVYEDCLRTQEGGRRFLLK